MNKIKIDLEYKCFPVWIYNENNELITNDLPEFLIGDELIDPLFVNIQQIYDSLFKDTNQSFEFRGFSKNNEKESFINQIYFAYNKLKEKIFDKFIIEIDMEHIRQIL